MIGHNYIWPLFRIQRGFEYPATADTDQEKPLYTPELYQLPDSLAAADTKQTEQKYKWQANQETDHKREQCINDIEIAHGLKAVFTYIKRV
ncbi:hypothetical protein D3C72_2119480 [compost metagenome]